MGSRRLLLLLLVVASSGCAGRRGAELKAADPKGFDALVKAVPGCAKPRSQDVESCKTASRILQAEPPAAGARFLENWLASMGPINSWGSRVGDAERANGFYGVLSRSSETIGGCLSTIGLGATQVDDTRRARKLRRGRILTAAIKHRLDNPADPYSAAVAPLTLDVDWLSKSAFENFQAVHLRAAPGSNTARP